MIGSIYNAIFYQPILNGLVLFYQTIAFQDLGVAIVLITILVRLILFPLFQKSVHHQTVMQRLQPKIKKLQEDHKDNREEQTRAMLALYKEHRVNPFSGFLLLLLQLPVLISLYHIFNAALNSDITSNLYSFVVPPDSLHATFLGLINLAKPNIILVGLAALVQYFQGRMVSKQQQNAAGGQGMAGRLAKQMVFVGPVMMFVIFINLPAALGLYLLVTNLFSLAQQQIVNSKLNDGKLGNIHQ